MPYRHHRFEISNLEVPIGKESEIASRLEESGSGIFKIADRMDVNIPIALDIGEEDNLIEILTSFLIFVICICLVEDFSIRYKDLTRNSFLEIN